MRWDDQVEGSFASFISTHRLATAGGPVSQAIIVSVAETELVPPFLLLLSKTTALVE